MARRPSRTPRVAPLVALAVLAFAPLVAPAQEKEKEEEERRRLKVHGWKLTAVFSGVADARGVDEGDATKTIKEKLAAAGDGKNLGAIGELFAKHPFAVVEKVAKNKGLSDVEADGLARLRRRMINEAMAKAVQALDPGKTLTIGMLDSGNKNSGIASDVDQTVFVMPKDKAKALGVDENKVIAEFDKQFQVLFKVKPERLGIESLNGADFFPDWRQAHSTDKVGTGANDLGKEADAFMREGDRVVAEKRKNPEAYRSEGQLKSQAEGRGYEALQQHHERVAALRAARDEIEELERDPALADGEKKTRAAAVEAELLKKYGKDYPAKTLAELEEKFAKDSPWTEVGWDEEGKVATSQLEDPASKVLANKPELHERFAFDGAWDNWLMYEHHPHNRRKYLLRSVAEGVSLRRTRSGPALSIFEYEKVFGRNTAESKAELKAFVDDVYSDLPEKTREQFRKALDVAAKERLRHKGAKNPSTGKDYTLKEVWSEFWPAIGEKEAALYKDMPKAALEKLLHERATRTWEAVSREVMIENLLRTVDAPAKLLGGHLSDAELAKVKEKHPDATRAKLAKAVQRQLYHGLHDLLTIEHARELVASPAMKEKLPPRAKDLVDRLIDKLGGPGSDLGKQVREIARAAAFKRVATEPGERTFRQEVYSYMRESLKEFLADTADELKEAKQRARTLYEEVKAGKITREAVAHKLTVASAERLASAKFETLRALGFDVRDAHLIIPDAGWPHLEVRYGDQKWDGGKLLSNLASAGNVDSALTVILAFQEGGAEAAAWAAGFELIMNVPGVAQANAVKDLVVHKRPEGVVMLGTAMVVPVAGQVFLFVSIAKTTVAIIGHVVLDPLQDDDADKMYQGFLDKRSGFKEIERSQRPSLLHLVPIRVIQKEVAGADGKKVPTLIWRRYTRVEAQKVFDVVEAKEYARLVEKNVLGGGDEWAAVHAPLEGPAADPKARFEAQRASMYYHFHEAIDAKLAPKKIDPDDSEALPILVEFFEDYVDQWVHAKGAFAAFDENVTISRRFEDKALRTKIATRAAQDYVRSWRIVHGNVLAVQSIERSIKARIEQHRLEEVVADANGMIFAIDEAYRPGTNRTLATAIDHELAKKKQQARVRAPRFHVKPRLVTEKKKGAPPTDPGEERIELLVSVLDGPRATGGSAAVPGQEIAPTDKEYRTAVRYELAALGRDEVEVTAYVTVTGAQTGEKIAPYARAGSDTFSTTKEGELAIKLGKLTRPGSLPESADLKVAYRLKDRGAHEKAAASAAAVASTTKGKPAKGRTTVDPAGSFLFDDVSSEKATARKDRWADKEVDGFSGQAWVCWEKAPLGKFYWSEVRVKGGALKYDVAEDGQTWARDRFPDQHEPSGRENIFIVPFKWPEGNVGSFTLEATIHAFDEPVSAETWRSKTASGKFAFTRSFEIRDERVADSSKVVLKYRKEATEAEIAGLPIPQAEKDRWASLARSSGGKFRVEMYEPFESTRSDLWLKNWDGLPPDKHSSFAVQLHVRWKDVPPDALYFYELEMTGGVPVRDEKKEGGVTPLDDFPPAPFKVGKGSSAFVIEPPFPINRGGDFVVKGTLHAVAKDPYPSDWRKAKSLGTLPFEGRFRFENKSRFAKGTYTVHHDAQVRVSILLAYVQKGRRPFKVEAGGKTMYYLSENDYYSGGFWPEKPYESYWVAATLPYGAAIPGEARVTFMDFGESVTLTVPLKLEGEKPDLEKVKKGQAENEKRYLARLAQLEKNPEGNIDEISRLHDDLASAAKGFDRGKWKEHTKKYEELRDKIYQGYLARAKNDDERKHERENLASGGTRLYAGAVEWGDAGEAESEFAAVCGRISGAGLPANDANGRLASWHSSHADTVFRLTGDLGRAKELWNKAKELSKGTSWNYIPPDAKCPFELDPAIKGAP